MSPILNGFSAIVTFLFATGGIYLALDYTVGRIKYFNSKFVWHGLQIKDFVFLAVALL